MSRKPITDTRPLARVLPFKRPTAPAAVPHPSPETLALCRLIGATNETGKLTPTFRALIQSRMHTRCTAPTV